MKKVRFARVSAVVVAGLLGSTGLATPAFASSALKTSPTVAQTPLKITSTSGLVGTTLTLTVSGGSGTGKLTYSLTTGGTASGCKVSGATLRATSVGTCNLYAIKVGDSTYGNAASPLTSIAFAPVPALVGTVNVNASPHGVAYDAKRNVIYVGNVQDGKLSVIDAATKMVTTTVTIPSGTAYGVAYDAGTDAIYVTDSATGVVNVVNASTFEVSSPITVGSFPFAAAYISDAHEVAVANYTDGTVSIINDATKLVTATVNVGANPAALLYDSVDKYLYVANSGVGTVSVINTVSNAVLVTIPVGIGPTGLAWDQTDKAIFVANQISGTVSVIKTNRTITTKTINVSVGLSGIAWEASSNRIYVANTFDNTVTAFDAATYSKIGAPLGVGSNPVEIAYASGTDSLYVTNNDASTVSILAEAKRAQATLSITTAASVKVGATSKLKTTGGSGSGAVSFTITGGTASGCSVDGSSLTSTSGGTCIVVATKAADLLYGPVKSETTTFTFTALSLLATLNVTGQANALAYDSKDGRTFVALQTGTVAMIDGATTTVTAAAVSFSGAATSLAYDKTDNRIYVAAGSNVYYFDAGASFPITSPKKVATCADHLAWDAKDNLIFLVCGSTRQVNAIDPVQNKVVASHRTTFGTEISIGPIAVVNGKVFVGGYETGICGSPCRTGRLYLINGSTNDLLTADDGNTMYEVVRLAVDTTNSMVFVTRQNFYFHNFTTVRYNDVGEGGTTFYPEVADTPVWAFDASNGKGYFGAGSFGNFVAPFDPWSTDLPDSASALVLSNPTSDMVVDTKKHRIYVAAGSSGVVYVLG